MNKNIDRIFREPKAVRNLIKKRGEIEHKLKNSSSGEMYHKIDIDSNQVKSPEELIYSELDKLIQNCRLSDESIEIFHRLGQGYSFREVGKELNIDNSNVSKRLNTICKKVVKEYRLQLLIDEAYKMKKFFKRCSKCEEHLPEMIDFFAFDKTNQCYKSACKKCRKR